MSSGVAALGACSNSPVGPEAVGDVMTGMTAAMLQQGSLEPIGTMPVAIGRDAAGVYAMTLTCPHQGCNIAQTGTIAYAAPPAVSLTCGTRGCGHGSTFDATGNKLGGPAPGSLQHFAVSQEANGVFVIHGGTFVDASKRLAV
ncbi:MAG: Rieske (2Fe-2S) protein [Myxococcales bacterium]|nr:Rieske (2Fe-2S) protein [Myxococcales bacterium]